MVDRLIIAPVLVLDDTSRDDMLRPFGVFGGVGATGSCGTVGVNIGVGVSDGGGIVKSAFIVVFDVKVNVQSPVPEQLPIPLHPTNELLLNGVATRVIDVPEVILFCIHVEPQSMDAPFTIPVPVPLLPIVNVYTAGIFVIIGLGGAVKFAVTVVFDVNVNVQLPVPVHGPLQPVNVLLALGVATRVIAVFADIPV